MKINELSEVPNQLVERAVTDMKKHGVYGVIFAMAADGARSLSVVGPGDGGNKSIEAVFLEAARAIGVAVQDIRNNDNLPPKHRGTL